MIIYFDSSALVKRYLAEANSPQVDTLIERAGIVGTSLITRAEVSAAIAKAVRLNWVTREDGMKALQTFRAQWADIINTEVTEVVVAKADSLAWEHNLRGFDAMHLASALTWQETLGEVVTFAVFDRQLWEAASRVGLAAWPESL
jgi:predicted nucleic acid-binding protein